MTLHREGSWKSLSPALSRATLVEGQVPGQAQAHTFFIGLYDLLQHSMLGKADSNMLKWHL